MADTDESGEDTEVEAAASGRGSRRVLALVAGGALLLIAAAGGGAYAFGLLDGLLGGDSAAASHEEKTAAVAPTFYALPEMLVSLNTGERRSTFLKLKVSLELANPQDQPRIEQMLPRVVDYCQMYLRELRLDEVRGSAGTTRLREELLRRIGSAVAPIPVKDVLFSEIFIQ